MTASDRTRELLDTYERLLREVGIPRGMVSRGDAPRLRERHIDDSLRAVRAIPRSAAAVVDVGSGGGLPGIPLAIVLPRVAFVLAERRANRADFLRTVVQELGLGNVEIHGGDVTRLSPASFDVATARAFADPKTTWATVEPLLGPNGRLLYWAGASFDAGDVPPGAHVERSADSGVAGARPLVIMTRQ